MYLVHFSLYQCACVVKTTAQGLFFYNFNCQTIHATLQSRSRLMITLRSGSKIQNILFLFSPGFFFQI